MATGTLIPVSGKGNRFAHDPAALAGLIVGVVVAAILAAVLGYYLLQRRRIRKLENGTSVQAIPHSPLPDEFVEPSAVSAREAYGRTFSAVGARSHEGLLAGPGSSESGGHGEPQSSSGHSHAPSSAFGPMLAVQSFEYPPSAYATATNAQRSPLSSSHGHSTGIPSQIQRWPSHEASLHDHATSDNVHSSPQSPPRSPTMPSSQDHSTSPRASLEAPELIPRPGPSTTSAGEPESMGGVLLRRLRGGPANVRLRLRGGVGSSRSIDSSTPPVSFFESPEAARARRSESLSSPRGSMLMPTSPVLANLLAHGPPSPPTGEEEGTPEGLLHPRLSAAERSAGTLSLRDDMDYSRPAAVRMFSYGTFGSRTSGGTPDSSSPAQRNDDSYFETEIHHQNETMHSEGEELDIPVSE
ncbi:hypothetical protein BC834DRAFT_843697 [Gloeopeniophorella convolvens]|nr:hypothetical protein BC834DRAFT_843697 [Gloeopeniophorella convolvens]